MHKNFLLDNIKMIKIGFLKKISGGGTFEMVCVLLPRDVSQSLVFLADPLYPLEYLRTRPQVVALVTSGVAHLDVRHGVPYDPLPLTSPSLPVSPQDQRDLQPVLLTDHLHPLTRGHSESGLANTSKQKLICAYVNRIRTCY
jgi:hypothetical protein